MYATLADLVHRFGAVELVELTDRADPPAEAIDETVVGAALSDAAGLIDAHVGRRYRLPLSSVPPLLVDVACDIARYRLMGHGATEGVAARYRDAVEKLQALGDGTAVLAGAEGALAQAPDLALESSGRVFGRDQLRGY